MSTAPAQEVTTTTGNQGLLWVGPDDRGIELEVIATVLPGRYLVIRHAHRATEVQTMTRNTVRIHGQDVPDHGSIDLDAEQVDLPDGTRLTEARAEELAAEVLHAAGRGRPSLTGPGRRSPQLRLSVPERVRDNLKWRAEAEQRSVSAVAREALERYLAS